MQAHGASRCRRTRDRSKRLIRRRDEPSCKRDALRLVGIEDLMIRALLENCGQLPRQVHRITDTGVHPLPADRTVHVCGVAEEERATIAETAGDAMMDVVG